MPDSKSSKSGSPRAGSGGSGRPERFVAQREDITIRRPSGGPAAARPTRGGVVRGGTGSKGGKSK